MTTLLTRRPKREISYFQDPFFNSIFNNLDTLFENPNSLLCGSSGFPKINVYVTKDKKYTIEATIAGYSIDDIEVTLDKDAHSISFKYEKSDEQKKIEDERVYYLNELKQSKFHKEILLPDFIDLNKRKQSYENGIIKIEFDIDIKEDVKKDSKEKLSF